MREQRIVTPVAHVWHLRRRGKWHLPWKRQAIHELSPYRRSETPFRYSLPPTSSSTPLVAS